MMRRLEIIAVEGLGEIEPGDPLGRLVAEACARNGVELLAGDILVLAQKIVSKSEGRAVDLRRVTPSSEALKLSGELDGKDPRLLELILRESRRIVAKGRSTIVVETRHGFVCANAGIDLSNIGMERALLLPQDPDGSARRIREEIQRLTGTAVGIVITDTFGRPWRLGTTDVAIGVAGFGPLIDYRGGKDPYGYELKASVTAVADQIAGAAELVMGKTSLVPVVIVRGCELPPQDGSARELIRPAADDLFRGGR
ncbi:MAG: coenzyme F420-0:L-glutamate ligase [Gammaproteobacteria bacterium]|nr:coenzyme F420-0:L-glutamate ligase [Gammaproteobacteria bacterium]